MNYCQKYCSGKWLIPLETNREIQFIKSYTKPVSIVDNFRNFFFNYTGLKKILGEPIFFWKSKIKTLFLFFIFFLALGGIGKTFTIIKLVENGPWIKTESSAGFYELIKVKNSLSLSFTIIPDNNITNNYVIMKKT